MLSLKAKHLWVSVGQPLIRLKEGDKVRVIKIINKYEQEGYLKYEGLVGIVKLVSQEGNHPYPYIVAFKELDVSDNFAREELQLVQN